MRTKELGMLVACVGLCGVIWMVNPSFASAANLKNLSRLVALLGLFAIGEAFVIVAGGIDLSVGSMIGFSGVITSILVMRSGWPVPAAILACLLLALLIGIAQGVLVAYGRLQSFVVTLVGMMVLRGIPQGLLQSRQISYGTGHARLRIIGEGSLNDLLGLNADNWLGTFVAAIPFPLVILLFVAAVAIFVLHFTVFGRYVFAIGGNRQAAQYSGVPVKRVEVATFAISGLLAGLAGIIYSAYLPNVSHDTGRAYELWAIAAAVLGGCSLSGGEGSIIGVIIGAAIMRVIRNGMTMIQVYVPALSDDWEYAVVGGVILVAVGLDEVLRRRART